MPTNYNAFLLRIWYEQNAIAPDGVTPRLSIQDVNTGERIGFHSLEELIRYLQSHTEETENHNYVQQTR